MKRYANENEPQSFPPALLKTFQKNAQAWQQFNAEPPGYRRSATWFVLSAKREETQLRRLAQLIEASARGKRLPQLVSPAKRDKYT